MSEQRQSKRVLLNPVAFVCSGASIVVEIMEAIRQCYDLIITSFIINLCGVLNGELLARVLNSKLINCACSKRCYRCRVVIHPLI